jgi:hypothetical protein
VTIHELVLFISQLRLVAVMLLYVGPDQLLPLLSIVGSLIGILLIWWRRVVGLVKRSWRFLTRKSRPSRVEGRAKLFPRDRRASAKE